jgi:hypothetical protein
LNGHFDLPVTIRPGNFLGDCPVVLQVEMPVSSIEHVPVNLDLESLGAAQLNALSAPITQVVGVLDIEFFESDPISAIKI